MATKLFLRDAKDNAIGVFRDLSTTAGSGVAPLGEINTAASGTEIQWKDNGQTELLEWISGRAPSGGFTLAGTMTFSIWARENNMNANCGARARVFKRTAAGSESEVAGGPYNDGVEFSPSSSEYDWTGTPTSTAFAENDRIIVRYYITNIGTMGGGYTCSMDYGAADASQGDSFFQINENVTFKAEDVLASATPDSIPSLAVINSPITEWFITATPNSLDGLSAVGLPTVIVELAVQATPDSIVSGEGVGNPSVTTASVHEATPDGITSEAAIGVFSISSATSYEATPDAIASGVAIGTLEAETAYSPALTSIDSLAAVGSLSVTFNYEAMPDSVASEETIGTVTTQFYVSASPTSLPSLFTFGSLSIEVAYSAAPTSITSGESVSGITAEYAFSITPTGVNSEVALGSPTATTATTGTATPDSIVSAEAFGTLGIVTVSVHEATPNSIESGSASGNPSALTGFEASPNSIASDEVIGSPIVTFGSIASPVGIESEEALGLPTFNSQLSISFVGIPSQEAFGDVGVEALGVVTPNGIDTSEAFGILAITAEHGLANDETVLQYWYVPSDVRTGAVVDSIASGEAFGLPTVEVVLAPIEEEIEVQEEAPVSNVVYAWAESIASPEEVSLPAISFSYEVQPYTIEDNGGVGEPSIVRRRTEFERLKQNNKLIIMALAS